MIDIQNIQDDRTMLLEVFEELKHIDSRFYSITHSCDCPLEITKAEKEIDHLAGDIRRFVGDMTARCYNQAKRKRELKLFHEEESAKLKYAKTMERLERFLEKMEKGGAL